MKTIRFLAIILTSILLNSCYTLKVPTIVKNDRIKEYKYIFISPTNSLTSGAGATYGSQYYSATKTVNPSDVIAGILSKEGFIIVPELKPELIDETIIISYGESGRRNVGLGGYTIEVTIQFISAKSHSLLSSCTAEGIGQTEADDIRQAITRCLTGLFPK
jgi:hypothetical protein